MSSFAYKPQNDCVEEAKEAYDRLNSEQKRAVDAAIVKKLSRNAYEASLRIYETRNSHKMSNLIDIFDSVVRDYTDPEKIAVLRGCMIGFKRDLSDQDIPLPAAEELKDNSNPYRPGNLREDKARELAAKGIDTSTFDLTRSRLNASPPILNFIGS